MTECAICLDGIYPAKYMLPCNHLFHVNCIKHWFRTCGFEPSCPICRYKINNFYLCKRKIHFNKSNPTFIKLGEYKIYLKEFGEPNILIDYLLIKSYRVKKNFFYLSYTNKNKIVKYQLLMESCDRAKDIYNTIRSKIHNSKYENITIMQMHTLQSLNS